MRIAEAAQRSRLSVHTLRFYESEGLVLPRRKGANRDYAEADIERLLIVSQLRDIGFAIPQIRELLSLDDRIGQIGSISSAAVDDIVDVGTMLNARIAELEDRVALLIGNLESLRAMRVKLDWLLERGGTSDETELDHKRIDHAVRGADVGSGDSGHQQ